MPFVKHTLGRTFFKSRGSLNSKPPLFCLHGGPGGSHKILESLLRLGTNRKVIMYDQLGGGQSSLTQKSQWTVQTFVRELQLLVDHWGFEQIDLYGASWGTTLALEYYLSAHRRRVRSLIFQSPMFSAKDWDNDAQYLISKLPTKTRRVIDLCHQAGATDSRVYQSAMLEYYLRHCIRSRKILTEYMNQPHALAFEIYKHMWGPSEFKPTGTLKNYNRVSWLRKIKVPTLFICGQHDEARPQTVKKYATQTSGAQLQVISGCSHALSLENPQRLRAVVSAFLNDL